MNARITPLRFRTAGLTDLCDQTVHINPVQAAGHAASAMTLKHYASGSETSVQAAAAERAYTA